MSTQTPPTPKGPRTSKRHQKKNPTPSSQAKTALLTTPPSSPPRSSSPKDTVNENTLQCGTQSASRKKNNLRSAKKSRENTRPFIVPMNNTMHHRHTSSQPNIAPLLQSKDSPHYAGPTFHASPAPSALPMPSFFSKSVPDSGLSAALEFENEVNCEPGIENTPSKPKFGGARNDREHEPSPLDFLFKAAIDARDRSQRSPEVSQNRASPSTGSKTYSAYRRPESSANGIFSLELEEPDRYRMPIGPAFSTPYRDRMNALRSASSPSQPQSDLDEDQRRAKTEALKSLLLNPRPQRPASASPHLQKQSNNPNVCAGGHPYNSVPLRTSSGPPTPVSFHGQQCSQDIFRGAQRVTHNQESPVSSDPHQSLSPSSALRQEVSPSHIKASQASYQGYSSRPAHHSPTPPRVIFHESTSPRATESDTKKMEDDLRRILKLDISSSMRPSGVQSSLA